IGPRADLLGRGEPDADRVEVLIFLDLLEQIEQCFHERLLNPAAQLRSRSMSMPSERISLTSTLNDSGIPASIACSPLTRFSYTLVRPFTSSDLTVSISCSMYEAP